MDWSATPFVNVIVSLVPMFVATPVFEVTVRVLGITDQEVLEYHWGHTWLVWDADETSQQHAQHVEYNLTPEAEDKTRVRFDITLEPRAPLPEFLIKRAKKTVLNAATEGLRQRVLKAADTATPEGGGVRRGRR